MCPSHISKILSHANGTVREKGIKIIAEICSAIGSKEPLNDVISSMKAAQVSQLDSRLSKMSTPSSPRLGLRFQNGSSTSSSYSSSYSPYSSSSSSAASVYGACCIILGGAGSALG